ncbi:MAG: M23 family metallopeptidase [Nitrosomonadales bacterium]|nr:M23 family metallopeptidase [Nitrosomonadales bacterium]
MKIIFVSKPHKKPISLNVESIAASILLGVFVVAYIAYQLGAVSADKIGLVDGRIGVEIPLNDESVSASNYEDNLNAYITQIAELHTRLINLDRQTERIQDVMKRQLVGGRKLPSLSKKDKLNGKGGPFINDELSEKDITLAINALMEKVEIREDLYNKMEAMMLKQSVLKNTLPSLYPVDVPYRSSSYGWRHDPILGIRAFHSGLDFSAATGEPIKATASGIVTASGIAPDYGKFIKIKHGDGLETRYAHASKLLVKEGDIVSKEQIIALVGSTGRSTGPHLHYEIRLRGQSLDPRQYIKK